MEARYLMNSIAEELRDISLKQEEQGNIYNALRIMSLSHELKPNGPFIKRKLIELRSKVYITFIVACRNDGLTERVNSFINGLILADSYGLMFKYSWMGNRFFQNDHHSVPDSFDEFLSPEFKSEYEQEIADFIFNRPFIKDESFLLSLPKKASNAIYFRAPNRYLIESLPLATRERGKDIFYNKLFNQKLNKLFYRISERIDTLKKESEINAIHFRSGDVIYGEYRKSGLYCRNKSLSMPFVEMLLVKAKTATFVFSASKSDVNYLKSKHENVLTLADIGIQELTATEQMLAEVVVMSSCNKLYGTASTGVTYLARLVGDVAFIPPHSVMTMREEFEFYIDLFLNRVSLNNVYQMSFFLINILILQGIVNKPFDNITREVITKLKAIDPENSLIKFLDIQVKLINKNDREKKELIAKLKDYKIEYESFISNMDKRSRFAESFL
jgi:hypothetical protein